jgi:hypothetical protein
VLAANGQLVGIAHCSNFDFEDPTPPCPLSESAHSKLFEWDGTQWIARTGWITASSNNGDALSALAYGGGRWVAVGDHAVASDDGTSWDAAPVAQGQQSGGVVFAEDRFVAVGGDRAYPTAVAAHGSTDGTAWAPMGSMTGASYVFDLAFSGRFVAVGEFVATSDDGASWAVQDLRAILEDMSVRRFQGVAVRRP